MNEERRTENEERHDPAFSSRCKSVVAATLWLAADHAVLAGLFWLLLVMPESNVATLVTSALIVVLLMVVAAIVEAAAVHRLDPLASRQPAVRHASSALIAFLAAGALFWATWWVTGQAARWLAAHRGEMDAWLVLHFNITRTAVLHSGLAWLMTVVRYVMGLSVGAAIVSTGAVDGTASLARTGGWMRRAIAPRRLIAIAVCWVVLLWVPWMAVDWRPRALPLELEPLFVAVKLAVLYLVANLAVALILRIQLPHRPPSRPRSPAISPPSTSSPP